MHNRAAKQGLAYALATTFMGDLDEAAIRKGRFDQRIGIFPPDLLSRVGRLTAEMQKYSDSRPRIRLSRQRTIKAIKIINKSTGFGMVTLGKPGWFTAPRPHTELKGAPFGYIFNQLKWPEFWKPESESAKTNGRDQED